MLLVSSVLFVGISLVAYLFVNTAKEYFGLDVSGASHLGIAVLIGFVVALSSVGIYRNHCKRCTERRVVPPTA